jgi:hypothetical protein
VRAIIMELLEGEDLSRRIARGSPSAGSGLVHRETDRGRGGARHIRLDRTPYFPLGPPADALVSPFDRDLFYEQTEHTEPDYNVNLRFNVRMSSYVHLGVFATVNNARDYLAQRVALTLKVLTQRLPTSTSLRVRSVPEWGGNQPFGY